jgi:pre-mRNA-processing factor 19
VDIHPTKQDLTITGGVDKSAIVFNRKTGRKEAALVGHIKKVTSALFHPSAEDIFVTGSADNTVRVWGRDGDQGRVKHTFTVHSDEIVGISLHASHDYVASASKDRTWAFHNIETGKTLLQVTEPDESPLTCVMLHPDGLILATGTEDNLVRIWDLKTQKNVATFRSHKDVITALAFSENGYYLSTAAKDNLLKLWDLRGPKNVHTSRLDTQVVSLDYDYSGKYLAAATGSEIRIFTGKTLDHVTTLDGHTDAVTGVKFGRDARFLASTSMDRTLKVWG